MERCNALRLPTYPSKELYLFRWSVHRFSCLAPFLRLKYPCSNRSARGIYSVILTYSHIPIAPIPVDVCYCILGIDRNVGEKKGRWTLMSTSLFIQLVRHKEDRQLQQSTSAKSELIEPKPTSTSGNSYIRRDQLPALIFLLNTDDPSISRRSSRQQSRQFHTMT